MQYFYCIPYKYIYNSYMLSMCRYIFKTLLQNDCTQENKFITND